MASSPSPGSISQRSPQVPQLLGRGTQPGPSLRCAALKMSAFPTSLEGKGTIGEEESVEKQSPPQSDSTACTLVAVSGPQVSPSLEPCQAAPRLTCPVPPLPPVQWDRLASSRQLGKHQQGGKAAGPANVCSPALGPTGPPQPWGLWPGIFVPRACVKEDRKLSKWLAGDWGSAGHQAETS